MTTTKNETVAVKGNTRIAIKWNTKTAEVRTWVSGQFIGAQLVKIEKARQLVDSLASIGFVGERKIGEVLGYTMSMSELLKHANN